MTSVNADSNDYSNGADSAGWSMQMSDKYYGGIYKHNDADNYLSVMQLWYIKTFSNFESGPCYVINIFIIWCKM